ncbi:MAG: hypothetical protein AAB263_08835 [Planctomycetota bacterium]
MRHWKTPLQPTGIYPQIGVEGHYAAVMRCMLCLSAGAVLIAGDAASTPTPTPPAVDQKIAVVTKLAPGALGVELSAPILPAWDKPVGDGFTMCGKRIATRLDAKKRLEVDSDGKGSFRQVATGAQLAIKLERDVDGKKRSVTVPVLFTHGSDDVWRWRNVGAMLMQIGDEVLVAVDVDGDGQFNSPNVDGLLWQGQMYAFPLPPADERWCTAKLDLTGFKMGPWGENAEVMGRKLTTTVSDALPVLQGVNKERVKIGLTPRPENPASSAAAQKHCHYMALNNQLAHPEDANKPGYSAEGHASGMRSILGSGTPADQLGLRMVQTFYHRQDVIRPQTRGFGVGYDQRYGAIDGRGDLIATMPVVWPVLCPARDQRGVLTHFANESPDPINGDREAGFPITAYFGTNKLKLVEGTMTPVGKDGTPGAAVDCYTFDPQQGGSPNFNSFQKVVGLIAKDPLQSGVIYRVVLKIEVDGKAQTLDWVFQTTR